jgi:hypothetical protein
MRWGFNPAVLRNHEGRIPSDLHQVERMLSAFYWTSKSIDWEAMSWPCLASLSVTIT